MKRFLYPIFVIVLLSFIACSTDDLEDEETQIPELPSSSDDDEPHPEFKPKFYFALPPYAQAGENYYGFIGLDKNQSTPGAKIDSVYYYINEELVAKVTKKQYIGLKEVFPINLHITARGGTVYMLNFVVYYSGDEYTTKKDGQLAGAVPGGVLSGGYPITVIDNTVWSSWDLLLGPDGTVKNTDSIEFYVYGINSLEERDYLIYHVNYKLYWDGTLVKNRTYSNNFSDIIGFIAAGPGIHKLKMVKTSSIDHALIDGDTEKVVEYEYDITVTN